tara:strand:- start:398 stop:709 length:312 start_codon:yes stop_codon:yes gene_type:complete
MELRTFLDLYEKEGIMNNKLNLREKKITDFQEKIDDTIVRNPDGTIINSEGKHLTLERGGNVMIEKIKTHKDLIKKLYLAHKFLIPLISLVIFFILLYKLVNK